MNREHRRIGLAMAALLLLAPQIAAAKGGKKSKKQHVHDHGHGQMSVAADGRELAIDFAVPAESIFGFEHEPKTDTEKKAIHDALDALRHKTMAQFLLPPELGCKATTATVKAAQETGAGKGEHADVDAEIDIRCEKPLAGATLKLGLLTTFPRLKELAVQIVSGTKQSKQTVKSADEAIAL